MKTHASEREAASSGATLYGLYVLAIASALVGNLLVRLAEEAGWLGSSSRIALAVVAVIPLIVAAVMFWRLLRGELDEMVQRIVLEGMAFALTVYLPLAALYVNLRTAGAWVPRLDPPDLLMAPALLMAGGILLAWRRRQ